MLINSGAIGKESRWFSNVETIHSSSVTSTGPEMEGDQETNMFSAFAKLVEHKRTHPLSCEHLYWQQVGLCFVVMI